jgi:cytochrome c oxidase subunit 2
MTSRLLVVFGLVAVTVSVSGSARPAQSQGPRIIEITAQRFEFWPSEVRVDLGEEVEIRLTSDDTLHGFRLVGTGTNVPIPKRGKGAATTRFTGKQPGRYTFECSRMCGAGHNFMRGVLIVGDGDRNAQ